MDRAAAAVASAYLAFAALWILGSDWALDRIVSDPVMRESVQTFKGLGFVTVTAVLLFVFVRRQLRVVERFGAAGRAAHQTASELDSRLRLVSEIAGVGIVLLDENHRYLFANRSYLAQYGRREDEIVGRHARDVWPEIYEKTIRPRLERALEGNPVDDVVRLRRADGSEAVVHGFYRAGMEAGRRVVVVVAVDISERVRTEEALRRSEAKFQAAFADNAAAIAITRLDDGIVVDVNETWEQLCRAPRSEVIGHTARWMWPSEQEAANFVAELKARGVVRGWEQEFMRRDGTRFTAALTTRLLERGGENLILSTLVDITDRRREAAARSEVEALFLQLFDQIPVAVLFCHRDGRLLRANKRLTELLGYTIADVPTLREWWPLAYPDPEYRAQVQKQWAADIEQALRNGGKMPVREYRVRRKDGGQSIVDISAKLIGQEMLLVLQDLTERRAVDEKMRFHESLLEDTGRLAKVGGWSFDVATGEGYWTNEVARIHDLDPGSPTSREVGMRFFTPDSRARLEQAIQRAIENREPYDLQVEIISAKGVHKWVRTIGHPVIERGRTVRVAGSLQDITALRRVEDSLRESEERLRQMAENIDEVFWMTDARKRQLLYVSPAFERIWGRPCDVLIKNPLAWFDAVDPLDRERVRDAMARQLTGDYAEEYRIVRPDGEVRWISDRAFPIRDAQGQVYRVVGVARDITETKHLEEQFLRSQRLEAVGTLASGVAHDLNNILAPIVLVGGMLKERFTDPADRKMLGMVEGAAQRGASIIAQLLTFSRGLSGERVDVQVEVLMEEVARLLEETFPRDIEIVQERGAELPGIRANPTQIHQVLMNLCVNARDAMPEGGELTLGLHAVDVSATTAQQHQGVAPGRFLRLSVRDTGTGIPPDVRARIFDPFFTTKGHGKGTGLGLSTVLGIVRSHGGFMDVETAHGHGTRFDAYLPVATSHRTPGAPTMPAAWPTGNGELVLVVDDEDAIRAAVSQLLEAHNYRVIAAPSAEEALDLFQARVDDVQLVVADLMLPGIDGWGLSHRLLEARPKLPIIICSGMAHKPPPDPALPRRVRAIVPKPFQGDELLRLVGGALGR